MCHFCRFAATFIFLFLAVPDVKSQIISGSGSVKLNGPATKEATAAVHMQAWKKLKSELLLWFSEEAEITIDTSNDVQNLGIDLFLDSCRSVVKTESSFKGKELMLSYYLTPEDVRAKLESFNAAVDARALSYWNRLQEAKQRNDYRLIYEEGMRALFAALSHIGPPPLSPDSGGRGFADDLRWIIQPFLDRMEIKSSGLILSGKTGLAIQNPPVVTLNVDSLPFAGMMFSGRLQNGAVIFSAVTDPNGRISIEDFKIPFVPNGTLLEICPNPAPVIGAPGFINLSHFGLKLDKGQVQTFIFKIAKPVYSLNYKATAVSKITMPPDFANEAHVRKFLRDSCYLQERSGNTPVDLDITIKAQVSSYSYDATEETGIKVSAQVIVNGLLLEPPKKNEQQMVFEKRYGTFTEPPYGLYFWEANGKMRETIKATIAGL